MQIINIGRNNFIFSFSNIFIIIKPVSFENIPGLFGSEASCSSESQMALLLLSRQQPLEYLI